MTSLDEHFSVRYARWDGVGRPFTVVTTSVAADPGPGRVLVEIDLATICGSDLHTVSGRRAAPQPGILGHEQVGRVVAVGSALPHTRGNGSAVSVGDRVVWSVTASCGQCRNCARGLGQKCLQLHKYGHERLADSWPLSGGFASHCLLLPGTTIVVVPASVPDAVAAPASCATATVAAALDAASARGLDRSRVLITGAGLLGVTAAAMAKQAGASVVVSDPDPARRAWATRFGADDVIGTTRQPTGFDVAIELSGAADAVETCLASLDVGGYAVLAGSVATTRPAAVDPEHVVRNLITVTGVHNYGPSHLQAAVDFLAAHHDRYPFRELVGHAYGLDRIGEALHAAAGSNLLRQAITPAT
ncbi:zinc-binding dehydrogenase [Mycobacterium sp. pUA109]|uniref:zinc-binding dehydrogenase n=1 Tax=Mycobacterium sp. pUA109 TaxID=3238982 RepID=UPI00351B1E58